MLFSFTSFESSLKWQYISWREVVRADQFKEILHSHQIPSYHTLQIMSTYTTLEVELNGRWSSLEVSSVSFFFYRQENVSLFFRIKDMYLSFHFFLKNQTSCRYHQTRYTSRGLERQKSMQTTQKNYSSNSMTSTEQNCCGFLLKSWAGPPFLNGYYLY